MGVILPSRLPARVTRGVYVTGWAPNVFGQASGQPCLRSPLECLRPRPNSSTPSGQLANASLAVSLRRQNVYSDVQSLLSTQRDNLSTEVNTCARSRTQWSWS